MCWGQPSAFHLPYNYPCASLNLTFPPGCLPSILKKIEKKKEAIAKKELQARSKEDMKTVALGTSKINYMVSPARG